MPAVESPVGATGPFDRIRNGARSAVESCLDLPWRAVGAMGVALNAFCGPRAGLGILTYHRIAPHAAGLPDPLHNVPPERFRSQLEGLLSRGFTFWPLSRLLEAAAHAETPSPKTVVVTFDDGYECVYRNAWPVLRELEIPCSVFVATDFIGRDTPFPFDSWGLAFEGIAPSASYRPMTWDQCRELHDGGLVEFGAHTHTHRDFREIPDQMADDVRTSADIVRDRFGLNDVTFAFPYGCPHRGFAGPALVEGAKRAGVVCGLTTESENVHLADDPFTWGRFNVFPWDTDATLAAKLQGWYGWAPRLRRRLAKTWRTTSHRSHDLERA